MSSFALAEIERRLDALEGRLPVDGGPVSDNTDMLLTRHYRNENRIAALEAEISKLWLSLESLNTLINAVAQNQKPLCRRIELLEARE
jgi:hypothetical protein